jgi:hypothetical protein
MKFIEILNENDQRKQDINDIANFIFMNDKGAYERFLSIFNKLENQIIGQVWENIPDKYKTT